MQESAEKCRKKRQADIVMDRRPERKRLNRDEAGSAMSCESLSLEGLKPEDPFSAQQLLFPFPKFPTREPNDPQPFVPNTRQLSTHRFAFLVCLVASLLPPPVSALSPQVLIHHCPSRHSRSVFSCSCSLPQARNLINHHDPRIFFFFCCTAFSPAARHQPTQKDFCHPKRSDPRDPPSWSFAPRI